MAEPSAQPAARVSWVIKTPRQAVYQAFLDRDAVALWLPPDNMTGQVLRTNASAANFESLSPSKIRKTHPAGKPPKIRTPSKVNSSN
jgi:hypothetical protein